MSLEMTGGDIWVVHTKKVTAAANLAGKTLITAAGAAVGSAANACYGVTATDVKNADYVAVKLAPSIVEVLATGTVTEGAYVEALQATVYANIDGTSTSTTITGVTDLASGYPLGKAYSSSTANGTALIALLVNQAKPT